MLDLLKRVRNGNTPIGDSRKRNLLREAQSEDFGSEKRKFLVKLLVQNTELKLACKEEKENVEYIIEKFFQKEIFIISDNEFLQQEKVTFSQKLGRITELKRKVSDDK